MDTRYKRLSNMFDTISRLARIETDKARLEKMNERLCEIKSRIVELIKMEAKNENQNN